MSVKETSDNRGFQQITSLSSATALTVPASATLAIIHVTGQPVRWRDDGTAPTATVGMRILPGGELRYDGNLSRIQLVEESASAVANIAYYS